MVLEVGLSESAPCLTQDAIDWLEARDSSVKVAITVKIYREKPKIIVRIWEVCEAKDSSTKPTNLPANVPVRLAMHV